MRVHLRAVIVTSSLFLLGVAVVSPSVAAPPFGPAIPTVAQATTKEALAEAMSQAASQLTAPDDPVLSAEQLVHTAVSVPELTDATGALAELLRRSGLPIVSVDGSLVGLPDRAGYPDAMVEIELLYNVARQLRSGAAFSFADVAPLFPVLEVTDAEPSWSTLAVLLSSYGKGEAPAFTATAGAAIRALAAERAELLDPYAAPENQWLDPVQMILITSQLGLQPAMRSDASTFGPARTPRGGVAQACANLVDSFKGLDSTPEPIKTMLEVLKTAFEGLSEVLGGELDKAVESGVITGWLKTGIGGFKQFNNGFSKARLAAKYISLLLLVDGINVRMYGDSSTHYKHANGEKKRNVRVAADVIFRQEFDKRDLPCFNLAGFEIPQDGPLAGQTVEWTLDQEMRPTRGGNTPAHLVPLKGATAGKKTLTTQTDADGVTSIELTPPVENFPGEGDEHRGTVTVRAKVVRDEADWELGDLLGVLKGCAVGGPAGCVAGALDVVKDAGIRKLTEVSVNALMPTGKHRIEVGYHGAEPLVVKGSVDQYFALAYMIKGIEVDLVSCNERSGPWIGTATFGGTQINAIGDMVQGSGLWNASALPEQTAAITNSTISLDLPNPEKPPVWELIRGSGGPLITGVMKLLPADEDWSKYTGLRDGRMASPVGSLRIGIAGIPNWLDADLTFTVYRVKSDPRCGGEPPFHWD